MNSLFRKLIEKPIYLLLAVNIIAGLFIFRDYGYSWDEPLFYDYGNALGYAYSPSEWFSGHFDLNNSYGVSGDDHKTRGPAYLLLSREPVYLLEALGLDQASAWHLVNFLFFQLGIYFLYRLARRWVQPAAALAACALFAWQPMLWGHAFLNPKDPPFLTFFLASVCLGFEMVERLNPASAHKFSVIVIPALFLGLSTSIRVLGPLAGVLVFVYFLAVVLQNKKLRISAFPWLAFVAYAGLALLTMFLTWPYLWESPLTRFFDVLRFMSDNPTNLSVLFGGQVYRAGELPRRYFPFMLFATLSEPVWVLFVIGLFAAYKKLTTPHRIVALRRNEQAVPSSEMRLRLWDPAVVAFTLILLWFLLLVAYVLLRRPAMYDGIRHFLFVLPPIFIVAGFAFEMILSQISVYWLRAGVLLVILLPGVAGLLQLHPYEYTYYNSYVGGTGRAFRSYETDYWLTCYKDAVQQLNAITDPISLYVHREAYIAAYYANPNISVHELRGAAKQVRSGDYVLVNSRTNEDRRILKEAEPVIQITRDNALFCVVKRVP